ncbi:hypothetical protein QFS06_001428 [Escherichia coli]|nr:hypothetical protein [Escherichia coli]
MAAQTAVYGRLTADPQVKTTSKGTNTTLATMAIAIPCHTADDSAKTERALTA